MMNRKEIEAEIQHLEELPRTDFIQSKLIYLYGLLNQLCYV